MPILRFTLALVLTMAASNGFGQTYQHPSGASFEYPDDWSIAELDEGVLLAPQVLTAQTNIAQIKRFIWVGAEVVEEGLTLADPRVVSYFDTFISSAYVGAQRASEIAVQGGSGRLDYQVDENRQVRVLYKFVDGIALYMAYSAPQELINSDDFPETFQSFSVALSRDPALVGKWYWSGNEMSDVDYSDAGSSYSSSSTQVTYEFDSQNRFVRRSATQISVQSASSDGIGSVSAGGELSADDGDYGKYSADGTTLTLAYEDGDSVYCEYSTFKDNDGIDALKLACGTMKPRFFNRIE